MRRDLFHLSPMSKRFCKFFARGACFKGEQCEYSHDRKDPSVDICRFYQKGLCAYGSQCRYKHVKASLAQSSANGHQSLSSDSGVACTSRGTSSWVLKATKFSSSDIHGKSLKRKSKDFEGNGDVGESSSALPSEHFFCKFPASNCPLGEKCSCIHGDQCVYCKKFCLHPTELKERRHHLSTCEKKEKYLQALLDSQEIECNICLEHVLLKPKEAERKFGVLPECDHAFCLSCISYWRRSAPTLKMDVTKTKNVRTCPVCRKLSYYVIPSNMWYSTKEEKQELIDNYKANCKLIDCKHFDFGNGRCPFGTNCFYKHTVKPGSYTWIHHKPPPPRRPNIAVLDQFNSLMPLPERLGSSVPSDSEDYDDEEMDFFNMASIPEAPGAGSESDTFSSEELDQFEIMPLSERMGGSVPSDSADYDDEEMDFYIMAVPPEAHGAGSESGAYSAGSESDTFSSEESDQFEIMPLSEGLDGSVPSDFEDSDDEEMNFFNMAAIPELPGAGSDTFSSEESDY